MCTAVLHAILMTNQKSEGDKTLEIRQQNFSELSTSELYEILKVRAEVFVVEQKCAYQDLDERDFESWHLTISQAGKIVAYLRLFEKSDEPGVVQIGRVLTTVRGAGLDAKLLAQAIALAQTKFHAQKIFLEAQCYASGFYERAGFGRTTAEFLEDGIPHVGMTLVLTAG